MQRVSCRFYLPWYVEFCSVISVALSCPELSSNLLFLLLVFRNQIRSVPCPGRGDTHWLITVTALSGYRIEQRNTTQRSGGTGVVGDSLARPPLLATPTPHTMPPLSTRLLSSRRSERYAIQFINSLLIQIILTCNEMKAGSQHLMPYIAVCCPMVSARAKIFECNE